MAVILIGNDSTDRPTAHSHNYTYIEGNYAADGTGELTSVWFRLAGAATVTLGVFRNLGNDILECRTIYACGSLPGGLNVLENLSIPIDEGDYLGMFLLGNSGEYEAGVGAGYWVKGGNWCVVGSLVGYSWSAGRTMTLGGSGATFAVGDYDAEIAAQLATIRVDYLPAVRAWIAANITPVSFYDYILACYVYTALHAGGAGTLYTGPTLQQIKDVLGTPYETTLADQHTAILASFSEQHTEQNVVLAAIAEDLADPLGALAIAEGNIEAAVTASTTWIRGNPATDLQTVLAAVEGVSVPEGVALTTDVTAAVGTLTGEVAEAVTDVNAHTDLALAGLAFATPADVTGAHATTDGKIDALNNLSALAVGGLVDAAVTTLTGEVGEAADLVIAAVDALPALIDPPDAAPVWPGIAGVTLGQTVALVDGLHLTTVMDGVIIAITTPPSRTGTMNVGGATFDYREGQIAFENDQGNIEMWQYLGFRNALYTPRSMMHAAGARFRVLAGAEGTVTPWTVTP